jgi:hypothetical protein
MAGKSTVPTNFPATCSAKPLCGSTIGFHFWHCLLRILFYSLAGTSVADTSVAGTSFGFSEEISAGFATG